MKLLMPLVYIICSTAFAQVTAPRLLPFQGKLTDSSGQTVPDGVRLLQFIIYLQPTGGNAAWAGEVHRMTVNGGLVNVLLGTKNPFPTDRSDAPGTAFFDQVLYLQITVDSTGDPSNGGPDGQITSADPPLMPRQAVLPIVFAKESAVAREADHAKTASLAERALQATNSLNSLNSGPVGKIIALWPYAPVPDRTFWLPCDGQSQIPADSELGKYLLGQGNPLVTPLLNDERVLLGGKGYGANGDNKLALGQDELPQHTHEVSAGGQHYHGIAGRLSFGNTAWNDRLSRGGSEFEPEEHTVNQVTTTTDGSHSHSLSAAGLGKPFSLINAANNTGLRYHSVLYYIKIR